MSISPLITFRAGYCEIESKESKPWKVKAVPDPGYIYLYIGEEDELVHFCWRRRSQPLDQPDLDLVMIPGDGSFTPYTGKESSETSDNVKSPTTGRIFVLKFSSSPERHLFWLQGKSKGAEDWFSPFDLRLGQIVDMILQGADVNVNAELAEARQNGGAPGPDRDDDDQDEDMEDAPPGDGRLRSNSTTGGAGADATGGDIREEGEDAREGGADGGRAATTSAPSSAPALAQPSTSTPTDAQTLVQNLLASLQSGAQSSQSVPQQSLFTSLNDLLTPDTVLPTLPNFSESRIDNLLSLLPPATILLSAQEDDYGTSEDDDAFDLPTEETDEETIQGIILSLPRSKKERILERVLRSPQFQQSLAALTGALREGGLPSIAEALGIKVEGGGLVRGGRVPLAGGDAVRAFLEGVRDGAEAEKDEGGEGMDES